MLAKLKNNLRIVVAGLALVTSLGFGAVQMQPAYAAPVDVLEKCDNESKVCKGTNKNSLYDLMGNVVNLLLILIGIISVIMIIIGGIRYTTSAGDAGQTKSARDTVIYAVAGLVVAIMAFAIVNFVLSRL
jgi:hypothetical protein